MKSLITFITLLLLSSCATTPRLPEQSKNIPQQRVYIDLTPQTNNTSKIVIVRDNSNILSWGAIGYHQIFINGIRVATIASKEKLEINLPPDDYEIGVVPTLTADAEKGLLVSTYTVSQNTKPGKAYYFRILIDANATTRIQRYSPFTSEK